MQKPAIVGPDVHYVMADRYVIMRIQHQSIELNLKMGYLLMSDRRLSNVGFLGPDRISLSTRFQSSKGEINKSNRQLETKAALNRKPLDYDEYSSADDN